jgi:hypothetical protein
MQQEEAVKSSTTINDLTKQNGDDVSKKTAENATDCTTANGKAPDSETTNGKSPNNEISNDSALDSEALNGCAVVSDRGNGEVFDNDIANGKPVVIETANGKAGDFVAANKISFVGEVPEPSGEDADPIKAYSQVLV